LKKFFEELKVELRRIVNKATSPVWTYVKANSSVATIFL